MNNLSCLILYFCILFGLIVSSIKAIDKNQGKLWLALGLVPLKLEDQGTWIPDEHYWGEENDPIEDWAKPIIAHGPRQEFEMEWVMPGWDPNEVDTDPICESAELKAAGLIPNQPEATSILNLYLAAEVGAGVGRQCVQE